MAGFTDELGISELDSVPSVENSDGVIGNSYAHTQWGDTWGTPLTLKDGAYRFQKKYLCFTFFIDKDDYADYQNARAGEIYIVGTKKNITMNYGSFGNNGNHKDTQEIINLTKCNDMVSHKQSVIRATILTSRLYDIGELLEVHCSFAYSLNGDPRLNGYVKLNKSIVYSEVYWYNGGKWGIWPVTADLDYIQKNQNYSSKKFCPWSDYSGTISITSKTRNGENEKNYFTPKNGKIQIQVESDMLFLHQRLTPTKIYFHGTKMDGSSGTTEVSLTTSTYANEFDSKIFSDFKSINKAYMHFGVDDTNKILIRNFGEKFLNCDDSNNFLLEFSKTDNINNELVSHSSDNTNKVVTLKSHLKGTINFPTNLFTIQQTDDGINMITLIPASDSASSNSNYIETEIDDGTLKFIHEKEYSCQGADDKLDISSRPYNTGDYAIKCKVLHNLKTELETVDDFSFAVKDLKFENISNKYVALGGAVPFIKYTINSGQENQKTYSVPGTIIIPDEYLEIPSAENEESLTNVEFFVYNLYDGSRALITNYYLGYNSSKKTKLEIQNNSFNVDYNTLKQLHPHYDSQRSETLEATLKYYFELDGENIDFDDVITYDFSYTLGRIRVPIYNSVKETQEGIMYFLQDNGGDIKNKTSYSDAKSQNKYLEERKNNNKYFSLSRQSYRNDIAPEILKLKFYRGNDNQELSLQIKQENLSFALSLLETHKSNSLLFDDLFEKLQIDDETKIIFLEWLGAGKSNLDIKLIYSYFNSEQDKHERELFTVTLPDLTFFPDVTPFGLRKNGVIVNPKENQDLDDTVYIDDSRRKNTVLVNVKTEVNRTNGVTYTPTNAIRIVFDTGEKDEDIVMPFFEIYLDSEGQVHLSNCVIDGHSHE